MFKFTLFCVFLSLISLSKAQLKSRAVQNFFCNDILNKQVKKEFDASIIYLSLANHFSHDSQALKGFSKMYEHNWKEETSHGEKLMSYVIKRGGSPCTPSFDKPLNDTKWSQMTVCQILEITIGLEKEVTDHLLKVHECARGDSETTPDHVACSKPKDCPVSCPTDKRNQRTFEDPQLQDFLESEYLEEQVESIKELADLLTRLERVGGLNCNGLGLHMIDQELSSKYSK